MEKFSYTLTAAAVALCAHLGVTNCNEADLMWAWLDSGGNFIQSCPNDYSCQEVAQNDTCVFISTYPTIGDLKAFERDGALNGPGGKSYACSRVAEPKPCVGDPNGECALIY